MGLTQATVVTQTDRGESCIRRDTGNDKGDERYDL